MLHVDAVRIPSTGYPESGVFPDPTTRLIDTERRQQYTAEGAHYESRHFLAVTYRPPADVETRLSALFFEGDRAARQGWEHVLDIFRKTFAALEDALSARLASDEARLRGPARLPPHVRHRAPASDPCADDPDVPRRDPRHPGPPRRLRAPDRRPPRTRHRDHGLPPGVGPRDAELPEPAARRVPLVQSVHLPGPGNGGAGAQDLPAELVPEAPRPRGPPQGIVQLRPGDLRQPRRRGHGRGRRPGGGGGERQHGALRVLHEHAPPLRPRSGPARGHGARGAEAAPAPRVRRPDRGGERPRGLARLPARARVPERAQAPAPHPEPGRSAPAHQHLARAGDEPLSRLPEGEPLAPLRRHGGRDPVPAEPPRERRGTHADPRTHRVRQVDLAGARHGPVLPVPGRAGLPVRQGLLGLRPRARVRRRLLRPPGRGRPGARVRPAGGGGRPGRAALGAGMAGDRPGPPGGPRHPGAAEGAPPGPGAPRGESLPDADRPREHAPGSRAPGRSRTTTPWPGAWAASWTRRSTVWAPAASRSSR